MMRKFLVLLVFVLFITGCAARHAHVPAASPIAAVAASRQTPISFEEVVKTHAPIVVLTGKQTIDDAVSSCKMGNSTRWHCWVVLPDYTFGYMRNDIIENPDGSAQLKTIYTPVGKWMK